jgi:D-alanyl-D-alanine carboxypeptidase (penicillin-binding protein 5/6)
MNNECSLLKLNDTRFNNPHGLADRLNKSSAFDLAQLSWKAMQNEKFREIVSTINYNCSFFDKEGLRKQHNWVNTNKLLEE